MWVFSRVGAVSLTVAPREFRPSPLKVIQVRARRRAHLERIIDRYGDKGESSLGFSKIMEHRHTDYPFRAYLSADCAAMLAYRMAKDIDYENFKGAAENVEAGYLSLLHRVWSVFLGWADGMSRVERCGYQDDVQSCAVRRGASLFWPDEDEGFVYEDFEEDD